MPTIVRRFGFEKTTCAKPLDKDRVLMQKGGLYRYFLSICVDIGLRKTTSVKQLERPMSWSYSQRAAFFDPEGCLTA